MTLISPTLHRQIDAVLEPSRAGSWLCQVHMMSGRPASLSVKQSIRQDSTPTGDRPGLKQLPSITCVAWHILNSLGIIIITLIILILIVISIVRKEWRYLFHVFFFLYITKVKEITISNFSIS